MESPGKPGGRDPAERPALLEHLGGDDRRFCMSGRCAIYYCLLDLKTRDDKRVAYLPAYTCETVIAPYKKAGYALEFYDVSPEKLAPRFDASMIPHISVLGLCGYYGFSSYDRAFVEACAAAGAAVLQDITHSVFSGKGIEAAADYNAGSLRKWIGIPSGGIAVKRKGFFNLPLLPPEKEHVSGRKALFDEQERVVRHETGASEERVSELFWTTEMRLRKIFDAFASDDLSREIISRFSPEEIIRKRRENYAFLLEQNPFGREIQPVFPELGPGICPSHLSLYSPDREKIRGFLAEKGVKSTVYWPFHGEIDLSAYPGAAWIYDHIFSVPIDQRYSAEDMKFLSKVLKEAG
jgi:hypothetical protein